MAAEFDQLVSKLKQVDNAQVEKEVSYDYGFVKEDIISISPYTIRIEYVDFDQKQRWLKFFATHRESGKELFFH